MKGGHPKEKGEEREEKEMIENFLKGQVSLTSWNLSTSVSYRSIQQENRSIA
jgi:hypothetical protein